MLLKRYVHIWIVFFKPADSGVNIRGDIWAGVYRIQRYQFHKGELVYTWKNYELFVDWFANNPGSDHESCWVKLFISY